MTYHGLLRDGHIEWIGEAPPQPTDEPIRVEVTVVEPPPADQSQRVLEILERLAAVATLEGLDDPVAWQRETRVDRALPGRDG
jgi:hypothetical protein